MLIATSALAKTYDPATATPKEKATVSAALLVVSARECLRIRPDPNLMPTILSEAQDMLVNGGYTQDEASEIMSRFSKPGPETDFNEFASKMACGIVDKKRD